MIPVHATWQGTLFSILHSSFSVPFSILHSQFLIHRSPYLIFLFSFSIPYFAFPFSFLHSSFPVPHSFIISVPVSPSPFPLAIIEIALNKHHTNTRWLISDIGGVLGKSLAMSEKKKIATVVSVLNWWFNLFPVNKPAYRLFSNIIVTTIPCIKQSNHFSVSDLRLSFLESEHENVYFSSD